MTILRSIRLEADSPRQAWYELQLVRLLEGFVVFTCSGSRNAKGRKIGWFFETLEAAEQRYAEILTRKTTRTSGRRYKPREEVNNPQGSLWNSGE